MTSTADLVSMADIARIAGQSRSTVGNWKARHADFPAPTSRTSRGPLYGRNDVEAWLQRTGRVTAMSQSGTPAADNFASVAHTSSALDRSDAATGSVLLSLRLVGTATNWNTLVTLAAAGDVDGARKLVNGVLPFVDGLIDWHTWDGCTADLSVLIAEITSLDRGRIPALADVAITRCVRGQSAALQQTPRGFILVPAAVQGLIAGLLDSAAGDVIYQAGPGLGQVMVRAAGTGDGPTGDLYIQESSAWTAQLARLTLAVHGLAATIQSGDVLQEDAFPELRADRVIATPPWDPKITGLPDTAGDPRWLWGQPGVNDSYLAWIQHSLYHLAEGGRVAILLPLSALFDRGRSARTLRRIVEAGHLEGVVSLPAGAIPGTSVRGVLMVLVKTPQDWATVMVDMSISPDGSPSPEGVPTSERARHVVEIYREAAEAAPEGGSGGGAFIDALNVNIVDLEQIAAHDFILDPGRHQYFQEPATGVEKMTIDFADMRLQLEHLAKACRAADQDIATMLGIEL